MLKDFQRDTVAYVMERYFGPDPTRRFLIADETGMGKSVVAGAIVAELTERLRHDDTVDRIDVVYLCSNQDIAAQNLSRLTGSAHQPRQLPNRLTLLGLGDLTTEPDDGKPVNFFSFTPGTSFDRGGRTGTAEERALIYHLIRDEDWDGWQARAAQMLLQCTSKTLGTFQSDCYVMACRLGETRFPSDILKGFRRRAADRGLSGRFRSIMAEVGRRRVLSEDQRKSVRRLVGELRGALAQAGVDALQPDLIILDEFQRFRDLLDVERGGEAAELADHLFSHPDARLLLLSATPYKPVTYAEEATTDDHHEDLHGLMRFLRSDEDWNRQLSRQLGAYRSALIAGSPTGPIRSEVRRLLLQVMCRTERRIPEEHQMLSEHITPADDLDATEVRSFVAMKRLATELGAPVTLDYWKSAPYFLNFLEGYQLDVRLRAAVADGAQGSVRELLEMARLLDPKSIAGYLPIDLGNSRLRKLAAQTVDQEWWQMLWLPPSMPYHRLTGPFDRAAAEGMTKKLIFSSWNATPTAVSALLSYEADVRVRQGRPDPPSGRLDYRVTDGRPAAMSTLALFWPHPGLADACDPQQYARRQPDRLLTLPELEDACRAHLAAVGRPAAEQPWLAALRWPGALPGADLSVQRAVDVMHDPNSAESPQGLRRHVEQAFASVSADGYEPGPIRPARLEDLTAIGMHAPGNIAWRALRRLVRPGGQTTPEGLWCAAAVIADGLRSLFNRAESMMLLDRLELGRHYWQAVLRYCASGGLQAVLDEYLHVLRSSGDAAPCTDDMLWQLALQVEEALTLHPAPYSAFNPLEPGDPIRITGRFALRHGGRGGDEARADRSRAVREAFNSPFWPFVLAATSAGQEGIDFHRYCSAVVHWNTPANPVDFEQREGRVHRFGGHAVRRNVAAGYRAEAMRAVEPDIWKAAYDAARRRSEIGDLMPYWVCPGRATIERHLLPLPLSRDLDRYRRLQRDLALYRLTFGQPRQEDMLVLLQSIGADGGDTEPIDLTPPKLDQAAVTR